MDIAAQHIPALGAGARRRHRPAARAGQPGQQSPRPRRLLFRGQAGHQLLQQPVLIIVQRVLESLRDRGLRKNRR